MYFQRNKRSRGTREEGDEAVDAVASVPAIRVPAVLNEPIYSPEKVPYKRTKLSTVFETTETTRVSDVMGVEDEVRPTRTDTDDISQAEESDDEIPSSQAPLPNPTRKGRNRKPAAGNVNSLTETSRPQLPPEHSKKGRARKSSASERDVQSKRGRKDPEKVEEPSQAHTKNEPNEACSQNGKNADSSTASEDDFIAPTQVTPRKNKKSRSLQKLSATVREKTSVVSTDNDYFLLLTQETSTAADNQSTERRKRKVKDFDDSVWETPTPKNRSRVTTPSSSKANSTVGEPDKGHSRSGLDEQAMPPSEATLVSPRGRSKKVSSNEPLPGLSATDTSPSDTPRKGKKDKDPNTDSKRTSPQKGKSASVAASVSAIEDSPKGASSTRGRSRTSAELNTTPPSREATIAEELNMSSPLGSTKRRRSRMAAKSGSFGASSPPTAAKINSKTAATSEHGDDSRASSLNKSVSPVKKIQNKSTARATSVSPVPIQTPSRTRKVVSPSKTPKVGNSKKLDDSPTKDVRPVSAPGPSQTRASPRTRLPTGFATPTKKSVRPTIQDLRTPKGNDPSLDSKKKKKKNHFSNLRAISTPTKDETILRENVTFMEQTIDLSSIPVLSPPSTRKKTKKDEEQNETDDQSGCSFQ